LYSRFARIQENPFLGNQEFMPTKKSADQPVSSSPAAAPQNSAPASTKSRARGSSAKPVTHKHKQNAAMLPEPAAAEITVPAPQPATAAALAPTHEDISIRAYLIAEARGFQGGSPEDDWFRAERELLAGRQ
jgi:DUF2934 family protein